MMPRKMAGAIVAGVVSLIVVIVLVLVIVLPSGKVSSGFTGVKIFTDPNGLKWSGFYYVYRSQPLLPINFEGQGDTEKVIDCSSEYRMQVYVGLDYSASGSITIESWVRGEIRETATSGDWDDAQVNAIC
jgi:hypothetical protein